MKIIRTLALVAVLAAPMVSTACAKPPPTLSATGTIAYTADQIVLRVNELENVAIQANSQGGLPVPITRALVEFCVSANQTLKATPAGWQATVGKAWTETKSHLPVIANPAVAAAIASVDVVLAAFGGN